MKPEPNKSKWGPLDWASLGLAGVTAMAGAFRVFGGEDVAKRIDNTTLTYFAVAGALLLLRNVKSLSFGDYKAEFQQLEARTEEAVQLARTAENMARVMAPARGTEARDVKSLTEVLPGDHENDPWKGQFGGLAESNGRKLSASVNAMSDDEEWFLVHLRVESTDKSRPLKGVVQFFLHDSFPNDRPVVEAVGGVAELRLTAWGAFTAGVLSDEGRTRLELDLAEDRSFPALFRSR